MSKRFWIIPLFVLFLLSLACASSTPDAQKVGEIESTNPTQATSPEIVTATEAIHPTSESEEKKPSSYNVGDVIETSNLRIVLTSAAYNNGLVKANISIENNGKDETNVSSMLSFSAKDSEGTVLEQEIFDCGSSLDGKILPGDRLRGDICYKMPSPVKFKIYFDEELFSGSTIVWDMDAAQLPQTLSEVAIEAVDNGASAPNARAVMEPVSSDSETITLTSAAFGNGKLSVNFLVENTGKDEISISSMVSFYAKDSNGVKLEQEFVDCGYSMDGKVLVGDHLRGNICWKLAQPDSVKVYYESNLFSSGAVVWELDLSQLPSVLSYPTIPSSNDLQLQAKVYPTGEAARIDGQTVTLNSSSISGNILKANFTVENTGNEEINVSSLISFYARSPEGLQLESEYISCGSPMDGQILPGDKLKGDICWKTGGSSKVTIYYEDEILGVGAIVWKVE